MNGFRAGSCAIAAWAAGTSKRLCGIWCPTFLLFGDADYLMHPEFAAEIQRMIQKVELKMVPGGTHQMH